jgi:hypothetical protein
MFRKSILFAALIGLLLIPLAVTAQDQTATPEPTEEGVDVTPVDVTPMDATPVDTTMTDVPGDDMGDGTVDTMDDVVTGVTIQEIVNDPAAYVDQAVEFEGDLSTFINSRIFVLSEDATIASDGVLVVNTTDQHLAPWVVEGRHYQLSGHVRYSINDSGGIEAVRQNAVDEMDMDPVPMSYDTVLMESILDGYEDYEIIEITDVNTVKGFATLAEIATDDVRYIGQEFYVVGGVGEFVTGNSFVLSDGDLLGEDRVLVTNADMAGVTEGQRVKVYGHLARFTDFRDDPEMGVDLADEAFIDYENYNVLRAESIEVLE